MNAAITLYTESYPGTIKFSCFIVIQQNLCHQIEWFCNEIKVLYTVPWTALLSLVLPNNAQTSQLTGWQMNMLIVYIVYVYNLLLKFPKAAYQSFPLCFSVELIWDTCLMMDQDPQENATALTRPRWLSSPRKRPLFPPALWLRVELPVVQWLMRKKSSERKSPEPLYREFKSSHT